jgi:hypothetical protein
MHMEKNIGMIDRLFRAVFGIGFLAAGLMYFPGLLGYLFLLLAAILVLTALLGFCPAYGLLGVTTVGNKWCDLKK